MSNGTHNVTWVQLIFLAGIFVTVIGALFFLQLDTRERMIVVESKFDLLLSKIYVGEITFLNNGK